MSSSSYSKTGFNTLRIAALAIVLATLSCAPNEESTQASYPLGVFDFDFARLGEDEASQIKAAQSIGYSGLALRVTTEKGFDTLKRYQAAIGDGPFKVHAALFDVYFGKDLAAQSAYLDEVIRSLKKSNAKLWLILRARRETEVERDDIVTFLRATAERTKAAGVELVIYPHWTAVEPGDAFFVETAEDAIPFIEEIQNGNVFVSLNLTHEIMAGNGDRLDEIAAKVKPWLRLATINGADIDSVNEVRGFKRSIQPLTMGDYDSSKLLSALKSVDYEGPVILLTWGVQEAAADHHHTSFKRYQEMLDELD